MRNEKLKIDEERGVVTICGEELALAKEIKPEDKGQWYAFANMIRADGRYDVALLNQRDEVVVVGDGYYVPSLQSVRVYPAWVVANKRFNKLHIGVGMMKTRRPKRNG